jgi:hypothetical protein
LQQCQLRLRVRLCWLQPRLRVLKRRQRRLEQLRLGLCVLLSVTRWPSHLQFCLLRLRLQELRRPPSRRKT